MTTATRGNEGALGVAVQSAEGSAAGTATYGHPIYSGLPRPQSTESDIEASATDPLIAGRYIETIWAAGEPSFPALPLSIGPYVKGILPKLSTSGAGGTFTHTFTLDITGATTAPFLTLFARAGGSVFRKFADMTVGSLALSFEKGKVLTAQASMQGYTPTDLAAAYTITTDELFDTDGPYFTFNGSTCKVDFDATPATTTVTNIQGGTLVLERELSLEQTGTLAPSFRSLGRFRISGSLDTLWESTGAYKAFKNTYFGGTAGTGALASFALGALDITFPIGPTASANTSLQVQLPSLRFMVPDPPDVDVSAGPLKQTLTFVGVKPSSGEPVTCTLKDSASTF